MDYDNQPACTVRRGILTEFLRQDRFRVRLDDGVEVTAAMPEELLPLGGLIRSHPPPVWHIDVEVELRKPPRMHRILHVAEPTVLTN
jgi:hypothetical protein